MLKSCLPSGMAFQHFTTNTDSHVTLKQVQGDEFKTHLKN